MIDLLCQCIKLHISYSDKTMAGMWSKNELLTDASSHVKTRFPCQIVISSAAEYIYQIKGCAWLKSGSENMIYDNSG